MTEVLHKAADVLRSLRIPVDDGRPAHGDMVYESATCSSWEVVDVDRDGDEWVVTVQLIVAEAREFGSVEVAEVAAVMTRAIRSGRRLWLAGEWKW